MPIVVPDSQWSRFFRPENPEDMVVGNPEIIGEALQATKKTLAMLIVGETGTGKTTLARALAQAINGNQHSTIEPASYERGIDDIKRLAARLKYMPTGKKWVVILDEIHLYTKDAYGALLKLAEDPPHKNILIVMCTNYARKVAVELKDRCKTIEIEKPELKDAKMALIAILKKVGLKVSKEERSKLATKAVKDADFCMRRAVEALESMHDRIVSGTSVAKVLAGKLPSGEASAGTIGEVEQDAGLLLSAIFSSDASLTDRLNFIMKKTSTADAHLVVERMIGILYHGYSAKQGGKWNWQSKPFGMVFDGKNLKVPGPVMIISSIDSLLVLQHNLTTCEPLSLNAVFASGLGKLATKFGK